MYGAEAKYGSGGASASVAVGADYDGTGASGDSSWGVCESGVVDEYADAYGTDGSDGAG